MIGPSISPWYSIAFISYTRPHWSAEKPNFWKVLDYRCFSHATRRSIYPLTDIPEFQERGITQLLARTTEALNLIIPATIGKPADGDDDAQKAYECYPKQHLCALAADARAITEQDELRRWYSKRCSVAENAPH